MDDFSDTTNIVLQAAAVLEHAQERPDAFAQWSSAERRAWLGRNFDSMALALLEEYSRGLGKEPTAAIRSRFLWRIAPERARLLRRIG